MPRQQGEDEGRAGNDAEPAERHAEVSLSHHAATKHEGNMSSLCTFCRKPHPAALVGVNVCAGQILSARERSSCHKRICLF